MKVQDLLNEARQANWKYNETRVKGALTKVTLALEGADSGAMTRLAKRYERLDKSAKLLKEKRDQLNSAVKDVGDRIFDAEDAVITRIIETVSYTVMLTAGEKAENKEATKKTDYESAFSELCRLVPELTAKIDEIRAKYTELIPAKDTPTALKVKPKEVKEGIVDSAKALYFRFLNSIKAWATSYDEKLAAVKAKYPAKGGKKAVAEAVGLKAIKAKHPEEYAARRAAAKDERDDATYHVDMDTVFENLNEYTKASVEKELVKLGKRFGVEGKILKLVGPGGGNPLIRWTGKRLALEKMLDRWYSTNDDGEDAAQKKRIKKN